MTDDDDKMLLGYMLFILFSLALGDLTQWRSSFMPPLTAVGFLGMLPCFLAILGRAPHPMGVLLVGMFSGVVFWALVDDWSEALPKYVGGAVQSMTVMAWIASILWGTNRRFRFFVAFPFRPPTTLPRDNSVDIDQETGEWHPAIQDFLRRHVNERL